jgi:hypothetical protein
MAHHFQEHRGFSTDAFPSPLTPTTCPVCSEPTASAETPAPEKALEAHLQQHLPSQPCLDYQTDPTRQHQRWRLDWDLVLHPRPDVGLFFCQPFGRYTRG